MANEGDDTGKRKTKSLIDKYDIPVDNLSFEFIRECKDQKLLERMLKVLRSGEEGYYPDLTRCCKDRLKELYPNSKVLMIPQDVLFATMKNDEKEEIKAYSEEIRQQDHKLARDATDLPCAPFFVPVRKVAPFSQVQGTAMKQMGDGDKKPASTAMKSVVPRSYADWDKFDPEEELLKMDLDEERKKEKKEKKNKMSKNTRRKVGKYPSKEVLAPVATKDTMTPSEQEALALAEKVKGNEFFQAGDYDKAVNHYTASITLHPAVGHYTNRAAAYLKLGQFSACVADCNEALALDPWNVKALYRRANANKGQGHLDEALQDLRQVMEIEPKNMSAAQLLCKLELENHTKQQKEWEELAGNAASSKPTTSRRMLIQELN